MLSASKEFLRGVCAPFLDRRRTDDNYRNLLDGSIEGVLVHQNDIVIYANRAAAGIFGYTIEELIGLTCSERLVHPDDVDQLRKMRLNPPKERHHIRGLRRDGSTVWLRSLARIVDWDGKPAYQICLHDLTAQEEAEQALKRSHEEYRALIDRWPQHILIYQDGRVVYANQYRLHKYGDNGDNLIGTKADDLIHPDDHEILHRAQASEEVPYVELRGLRPDGSTVHLACSARDIQWEGRPARLTVFNDITDFKKAEDELRQSEERFRQLSENIDAVFWMTDVVEDRVLYVSPSCLAIYGHSVEEMCATSKAFVEAIIPEDRERVVRAFQLQAQGDYDIEYRINGPNGSQRWIRDRAFPIHDADGQVYRVAGIAEDVTERKRVEEALSQSEERFRATFESISIGNIVTDSRGTIEAFNSAALRLFGYTAKEVIGENIDILMPEPHRAKHDEYVRSFPDSGNLEIMGGGREVAAIRKNGSEFPAHCTVGQMKIGGKAGFIAAVTDLTDLKALETRLLRTQKMESVGQLTGGVAHDFNNLMAIMLGNSELLKERIGDDPKNRRLLDGVIAAVERGASLTRRLLAYSGQQHLSPRDTDVNTLLVGVVEWLQASIGETIDLSAVAKGDLWPALIDPSELEHALVNLVLNARDAMPEGGRIVLGTANVTLDEDQAQQREEAAPGDYVMVAVSDTGTGMAPEVLARASEPFYTTKEFGEGSGLGLSVVYGFVRQSGGHITLESEPGQGTKIELYLPRSSSVHEVAGETAEEPAVHAIGDERILVVEDYDAVRDISVAMLRQQGYRVSEAGNGREALAYFDQGQVFDLLFTDVVLPGGMNGVAVAEQAQDRQPGIKVLYTSGYADKITGPDGRPVRDRLIVAKPCRRSDLLDKVRATLDADHD